MPGGEETQQASLGHQSRGSVPGCALWGEHEVPAHAQPVLTLSAGPWPWTSIRPGLQCTGPVCSLPSSTGSSWDMDYFFQLAIS